MHWNVYFKSVKLYTINVLNNVAGFYVCEPYSIVIILIITLFYVFSKQRVQAGFCIKSILIILHVDSLLKMSL